MHKQAFVAISWCLAIGAAVVAIREANRSRAPGDVPVTMAASAPSPSSEAAPEYRGNVKTHKFHRLSCRYAACRNCTASFITRDEAIAAAYRPGACCDP